MKIGPNWWIIQKMNAFWSQTLLKQAAITAFAALGLNAAFVLIQWYIVSPIGYGGLFLLAAAGLILLSLLVIFLALLSAPFLLVFRKTRRTGLTILVCAPVYLLIGIVQFGFSINVPSERGRRVQCSNNLKSIGLSINLYRYDQKEGIPRNILQLIKYIGGEGNVQLFVCPTKARSLKGTIPRRISDLSESSQYSGYDSLVVTSSVPGMVITEEIAPALCDKPGNHGKAGINILLLDGHTIWWPGTIEEYAASNSLIITVNTNWLR